jgi:hypothetical protein
VTQQAKRVGVLGLFTGLKTRARFALLRRLAFFYFKMKYFLHDSNSFNDEKITELYLEFGYEGLGLFYTILEKLALQEKPIKTNILKHQLNVGKKLDKCWSFMEQIDLISSNNGETFNKQLLNFSEKYQIKKEKNAKRILEWRENQQLSENVTRSEYVRNTPKVKESKVNEINHLDEFEIFWNEYNKKVDRAKTEKVWSKLTDQEVQKILANVKFYVQANPDLQYRKNPLTYLNGKCFNDEIQNLKSPVNQVALNDKPIIPNEWQ